MSQFLDIFGWLAAELADNDDLVAVRVKLNTAASWLADQPAFEPFDEPDAPLDELLAYLADNLPSTAPKDMAAKLERAASAIRDVAAAARRASYDLHFEDDDPELRRLSERWQDTMTTLEELERSGVLGIEASKA